MISIAIIYLFSCITRSQPANDDPCNAIEIDLSAASTIYQGASTSTATISSFEKALPFCGTGLTSPSVWYKISGVTDISVEVDQHSYDTKLTLWVAEDCNDVSTFTCINGNDDGCDIPGFGSCVEGGIGECYDEIYIQLHGFGGSEGETNLVIDGTKNAISCGNCGHTWNTGPNKAIQCATDDDCCSDFSCNADNGKCNIPTDGDEIICGHIQNSGPNKALNCNDIETDCCDEFTCNTKNGKCIKKALKEP